jgi:CHAT domain-containing protein/Tfp pilus assembly protein PilF
MFILCVLMSYQYEATRAAPLQDQASAIGLLKFALSLHAAGDFERESSVLKEALALSQKARNRQAEVSCLIRLGVTLWDVGEIHLAAQLLEEALPLARELEDKSAEKLCKETLAITRLYNAGKEQRSLNHLRQSLDCFAQAIRRGKEIDLPDFELKCLRQMSLTYWQMENIQKFLEYNKRGLEIAERIHHGKEQGRCLNNIGVYYDKISDYSNALRYFERALEVSRFSNDVRTQAESSANIGGTYLEFGELQKAEAYYQLALTIDRSTGNNENVAQDLNNIGIVLTSRSRLSNSRHHLENALGYFKDSLRLLDRERNSEVIIQVLNNIGFILAARGDYESARHEYEDSYNKAKELNYKRANCVINVNLGNLYLSSLRYQDATAYFNVGIQEATETSLLDILWEAYYGLGRCFEGLGDLHKALSCYERSMETVEAIREGIVLDIHKIGFVRNKLSVYEHSLGVLYSLYLADPSPTLLDKLFMTMEKAKARAFLEYLAEARVDIVGTLDRSFKRKEKELSHDISGLFAQLARPGLSQETKRTYARKVEHWEEEYLRLLSDVRTENRELKETTAPEICNISMVQNGLLDKHTALMEYFVGETKSYLSLLTRDHSELFALPGRQALEKSLKVFLIMLSSPSKGRFQGDLAAERIAKEMAFPLESSAYKEIDSLIIVPDGILHYLPFETLRNSSSGKGSYFVEKYQISYSPSASSLLFLKQLPKVPKPLKELLAVGAPFYPPRGLSPTVSGKTTSSIWRDIYTDAGFSLFPLPYSKKEVIDIAKYFPVAKRDILLGRDATEAAVKALPLEDYRIIHFACHGLLDEKFPFRSALVLSSDDREEEDGFLQVREIYNLNMQADLVVLSACQTGSGALERIEGLLGLPRTFFYAGAHSVLASLWPINDRTSAAFMNDFYRCLLRGESRRRALQSAKLRMLRSGYSHPSYWAGYVLHGDSGPIDFEENSPEKTQLGYFLNVN